MQTQLGREEDKSSRDRVKARVRNVNTITNKGARSQNSMVHRKSQLMKLPTHVKTSVRELSWKKRHLHSIVYLAANITKNTADYQM